MKLSGYNLLAKKILYADIIDSSMESTISSYDIN